MSRTATNPKLMIPLILAVALVAAHSGRASGVKRQPTVRTANNVTLHEKVLVNGKGLTLYSLSAERRGKFICTDKGCLSAWTPLIVPKGTTPTGVAHLGTVRRPDGRTQVAYRGLPVYTFNGDQRPGDVKGNGFKDVGVWRPASPAPSTSTPAPQPSSNPGSPGYGY